MVRFRAPVSEGERRKTYFNGFHLYKSETSGFPFERPSVVEEEIQACYTPILAEEFRDHVPARRV